MVPEARRQRELVVAATAVVVNPVLPVVLAAAAVHSLEKDLVVVVVMVDGWQKMLIPKGGAAGIPGVVAKVGAAAAEAAAAAAAAAAVVVVVVVVVVVFAVAVAVAVAAAAAAAGVVVAVAVDVCIVPLEPPSSLLLDSSLPARVATKSVNCSPLLHLLSLLESAKRSKPAQTLLVLRGPFVALCRSSRMLIDCQLRWCRLSDQHRDLLGVRSVMSPVL